MNFVNAELTKISVNTYVTMKISFANMLGEICDRLEGADAAVVADAIGRDTRIGKKYLTPAVGYGGPCLPARHDCIRARCSSRRRRRRSCAVDGYDQSAPSFAPDRNCRRDRFRSVRPWRCLDYPTSPARRSLRNRKASYWPSR